jgi:hypothetical protein
MQKIYGILRKLNSLKKQENQLETGMEMGSKKPLLSFRAEPVCDLLGDQGALPPARLLIMRKTWNLSFMASLTIFPVSSIISESSMPESNLSEGKCS